MSNNYPFQCVEPLLKIEKIIANEPEHGVTVLHSTFKRMVTAQMSHMHFFEAEKIWKFLCYFRRRLFPFRTISVNLITFSLTNPSLKLNGLR